MNKPVIGILGSILQHTDSAYAAQRTYANTAYLRGVERNGGIPFVLPAVGRKEDLYRLLDLCDGLLFPGGDDLDPRTYGEPPHPSLGGVNREVDHFWFMAEERAQELGLPVFGICRGMQAVNVSRGGSLWQDISLFRPDHQLHVQRQNRDYPIQKVKIHEGSRLEQLLGANEIYTNTLHHQCVNKLGRDLTVTAWAEDGVPEAMESADGRIVLVQWHPEELVDTVPPMNQLFRDLVEKAMKRG